MDETQVDDLREEMAREKPYLVTFFRETIETVKVYADSKDKAVDLVYDSFGQDMSVCKSINMQERNFMITYVEEEKKNE